MKVLISSQAIEKRIGELADEISADYGDRSVTIVGVLTGSLIFVADLVRRLRMPMEIGFIRASSYRGTATKPGSLKIYPELMPEVTGREVLLLDDILDTGRTLGALIRHVREARPASLRVAVLLRKDTSRSVAIEPDYCGFDIPDRFVVGYGLDFNNQYRNLPFIAELSPADTGS